MLVLLSPSKQMSFSDINIPEDSTLPLFSSESLRIMNSLTELDANQLSNLLKCNLNLAKEALRMAYDFSSEASPVGCAAYVYSGVAFKGLNPIDWSTEDDEYAQKTLRIGSGVYGLLRPFDIIKPYRLDLGSKVRLDGDWISLHRFWKSAVTSFISEDIKYAGNVLINCSSAETFDMLDLSMLKHVKIIQARFLAKTETGYKSAPTVFVKKARGALASFIIRNRITKIDELSGFNAVNMRYEPLMSDEYNAVFLYDN